MASATSPRSLLPCVHSKYQFNVSKKENPYLHQHFVCDLWTWTNKLSISRFNFYKIRLSLSVLLQLQFFWLCTMSWISQSARGKHKSQQLRSSLNTALPFTSLFDSFLISHLSVHVQAFIKTPDRKWSQRFTFVPFFFVCVFLQLQILSLEKLRIFVPDRLQSVEWSHPEGQTFMLFFISLVIGEASALWTLKLIFRTQFCKRVWSVWGMLIYC